MRQSKFLLYPPPERERIDVSVSCVQHSPNLRTSVIAGITGVAGAAALEGRGRGRGGMYLRCREVEILVLVHRTTHTDIPIYTRVRCIHKQKQIQNIYIYI